MVMFTIPITFLVTISVCCMKQELIITPKPTENRTKEALKATQAKEAKEQKEVKEAKEAKKIKKAKKAIKANMDERTK